jgi:hypothetical protein
LKKIRYNFTNFPIQQTQSSLMKFLKILILGPLSILSLKSTAQVEDLMRDKNITWIGEFTSDYVVEGYKFLDTLDYLNSSKLLKFFNPSDNHFLDSETPFESKIRGSENRVKNVYNDSSFTIKWKYYAPDTIEKFDSVTNERKQIIVFSNWVVLPNPKFYKARQILFYDKKKANFGLRILAIALIQNAYNEEGEVIGLRDQGWIKPTNIGSEKVNWANPNIIIARRLTSRQNSPILDSMNILKNTIGDIKQTFIDDLSRKKSINLYGDEGDYTKKHTKTVRDSLLKNIQQAIAESKLPKDSSQLAPQKDSAKVKYVYYNRNNADSDVFPDFTKMGQPDTAKKINKPTIDSLSNQAVVLDSFPEFTTPPLVDSLDLYGSKAIYKLRIIQDWYWDEKLKNICVRLFAIAPMKKIYNEAGEFLFDLPLFYRLND